MKPIFFVALIACLPVAVQAAAPDPEKLKWVLVIQTAQGAAAIADAGKNRDLPLVMMSYRFKTTQSVPGLAPVAGIAYAQELDCKTSQYQDVLDVYFGSDSKILASQNSAPGWKPFSGAGSAGPVLVAFCLSGMLPANKESFTGNTQGAQAWLGGKLSGKAAPAAAPLDARNLPDRVKLREVGSGGVYEAIWVKRPGTKTYDSSWIYLPTGEKFTGAVEIKGVIDGKLIVDRPGVGTYTFPVDAGGTPGRGKASWVSEATFYVELIQP